MANIRYVCIRNVFFGPKDVTVMKKSHDCNKLLILIFYSFTFRLKRELHHRHPSTAVENIQNKAGHSVDKQHMVKVDEIHYSVVC